MNDEIPVEYILQLLGRKEVTISILEAQVTILREAVEELTPKEETPKEETPKQKKKQMADIIIPHLALPLKMRFDNVGFAVNEQDSLEDIVDCVETILRFPSGFRIDVPEFGTPDQAFHARGASGIEIKTAILEWEPRADILVDAEQDAMDELISRVQVSVFGKGGPDA